MDLLSFFLGASVMGGVTIGIGIIIPMRYFVKHGLFSYETKYNEETQQDEYILDEEGKRIPSGLINAFPRHKAKWADIAMSSVMLAVGFTKATLAIPLAVAGLCVSAYVRTVTGLDQDSFMFKFGDGVRNLWSRAWEWLKDRGEDLTYSWQRHTQPISA